MRVVLVVFEMLLQREIYQIQKLCKGKNIRQYEIKTLTVMFDIYPCNLNQQALKNDST